PDGVAGADGMARGAVVLERVLTLIEVQHRHFGKRAQLPLGVRVPAVQPVADGSRQELRVVERRVADPLAGRLVSDEEGGRVAVRVRGVLLGIETELPAVQLDVRRLAGEEEPTGPDVIFLRVLLANRRPVVPGIDRELLADLVAALSRA